MVILKIVPEEKLKANVMLILRIFLNQKSSKNFLRKMHFNWRRYLQFFLQYLQSPPGGGASHHPEWVDSPSPLFFFTFA
jgi:hypothetical protein